jgi:transcriptional regulator with XRE-family HTH domain
VGQAIGRLSETSALSGPARAPEPLGRWLARERRLRGLSLDEVAAATRIPRRSLERLEAGAFDSNPDGFTRGFVRAVAGALGLDPAEAQARLLSEPRPLPRRRVRRLPLWLPILAVALVLGVALAAWLPSWWTARGPAPLTGAPQPPELRRRDFVRELAARAGQSPPSHPDEASP